ncbi:MAG: PEP-CTERM sorting domain-containing protein [Planctomycetota bacterium]
MTRLFTLVSTLSLTFLAFANLQPAFASIVTYSDTTFNNGDWSLTTLQKNNGGSVLAFQSGLQVNSAPWARFVEHNINAGTSSAVSSVAGLHLRNGATWDPAQQGELSSVCFSIDYDFDNSTGSVSGSVGLGALLFQGGKWYAGGYSGVSDGTGFTNYTAAPLTASSFSEVDLGSSTPVFNSLSKPDFSAAGGAMTFGFMTGNSNSASNPIQYSRAYFFDDWSMTLKAVPEPGSGAVLLIGSALFGLIRRRR